MSRSTPFVLIGTVMTGFGVIEIVARSPSTQSSTGKRSSPASIRLVAELVAPANHSREEVLVEPRERVEFLYALHNPGESPIHNLHVTRMCGCKVTREIPAQIAPGETIHFGFELTSPAAGSHRQSIALVADGSEEPLAVLNPALRSRLNPPRLVHYPAKIVLSAVRGEESTKQEALFTSVEFSGSEPLIADVSTFPRGLVSVEQLDTIEQKGIDPQTVRRTYRFQFTAENPTLESSAGFLQIQSGPGIAYTFPAIPIDLRVLEAVELVPAKLTLDVSSQRSAQVIVVRRGASRPPVHVSDYDSESLEVKRLPRTDSGVEVFQVTPRMVAQPATVHVRFAVGNDSRALTLPVVLKKSTGVEDESESKLGW